MRSRSILLPILGGLSGIAGTLISLFHVFVVLSAPQGIISPWEMALHLAVSVVTCIACIAISADSIGRRGWSVEGWTVFGAWSLVTLLARLLSGPLTGPFERDYYLPLFDLLTYGPLWLVLAGKLLNVQFPLIRVEGRQHTWDVAEPNAGANRRPGIGLVSFGLAMLTFLLLSILWIEPSHDYEMIGPRSGPFVGSGEFSDRMDAAFSLTVPLLALGGLWAFQVLPFPRRARKILLWTKMVLATCFGALAITAFIAYAHPAFGVLAIVFLVQLVAALYIAGPVLGWSVKFLPGQSEFTR